jgi:hypothetical protein
VLVRMLKVRLQAVQRNRGSPWALPQRTIWSEAQCEQGRVGVRAPLAGAAKDSDSGARESSKEASDASCRDVIRDRVRGADRVRSGLWWILFGLRLNKPPRR